MSLVQLMSKASDIRRWLWGSSPFNHQLPAINKVRIPSSDLYKIPHTILIDWENYTRFLLRKLSGSHYPKFGTTHWPKSKARVYNAWIITERNLKVETEGYGDLKQKKNTRCLVFSPAQHEKILELKFSTRNVRCFSVERRTGIFSCFLRHQVPRLLENVLKFTFLFS